MFKRLVKSALLWDFERKENDVKNFRLLLFAILQDIVYFGIQHLLLYDFTNDTSSIVNNDIGRARAWVNFYARRVDDEDKKILPHRTFICKSLRQFLGEEKD